MALCAAAGVGMSTPAWAADGVDLRPHVSEVTFGGGSVVVLHSLTVDNKGTANATHVIATVDLVPHTGSRELVVTGQRAGCTPVSDTRATCPLPDIAASGSATADVVVSVIELRPTPGSVAPKPMATGVKVTITAQEPQQVPGGNVITSPPILRTVVAGATTWIAGARRYANDAVGDLAYIELGSVNRGPGEMGVGETVETFVAPPGTEWAEEFWETCVAVRPRIEYRCTSEGSNPPDQEPLKYDRTFRLRILTQPTGVGEYRVEGMGGQITPGVNVARIDLNATGTPPATAAPTNPAPAAPTNPAPAATRADSGALATTGSPTARLALAGTGALVLGTVLLLLARRRSARR